MSGILSGVRIADFTEYIAGPYCTMVLADLGADVLKIEPPGGDRMRFSVPLDGEGRGFLQVNRTKRSFVVDLKKEDAAGIVRRIVERVDAVVVNLRPQAAKRLGIDYETLAPLNPRLVYGEITAYGHTGPYAHRGAFDMVAQAVGGVIAHEGTFAPDGLGMTTTSISDYSAGVFLALGIVGALLARERTGRGQKVETNLLNAILACQYRPMNNVERFDAAPRREFAEKVAEAARAGSNIRELFELRQSHLGANTRNIYWRPYATKDGFLAVACLNNVMRRSLRDLLGIDDPAIDGTSYGGTTREENAALVAQVEPIFRSKTTQEWFKLLDEAGVPCGPLNVPEQVFDDPQVVNNGAIWSVEHERVGEIRMPGHPVRYSESRVTTPSAPPVLGDATRQTLEQLGYGPGEIERLIERGVVFVKQPPTQSP